MARRPSRIIVITSILIVFAAIAVSANWFGGSGVGLLTATAAANPQEDFAAESELPTSEPRPLTTPLNAITAFDAALISRHFNALPPPLNADQLTVAKVYNGSTHSPWDILTILYYVTGHPWTGLTGTTVSPGLLMGDVSGAGPHYNGNAGNPTVSLPTMNAGSSGIFNIPVTAEDLTGLGIISFEFQVTFDPTVIQLAAPYDGYDLRAGTLIGNAWKIVPNGTIPGHLIISGHNLQELAGSGTLINLRFNVVGSVGQSTTVTFEDYTDPGGRSHQGFLFNEGTPSVSTANGSVTLVVSTPTATTTPTADSTPTASYSPTASYTPTASSTCIPVTIPYLQAPVGSTVAVPVNIDDVTGRGVYSVDTQIGFDPNVLSLPAGQTHGVTLGPVGNSNASSLLVNSSQAGTLSISLLGNAPMTGAGVLVYLHFNVIGAVGTFSGLGIQFAPGGNPCFHPVEGGVTVVQQAVPVSLPDLTASQGAVVTIPITSGSVTGLGVTSYDAHIVFDPAVLQPASTPCEADGTMSSSMVRVICTTYIASPGHLNIGAFQNGPMTGSGTLLNLRFNVVGTPGESTPLTFEDWLQNGTNFHPAFTYNEGDPAVTRTNGSITITGGTPTASPTATATSTPTPTASPVVIVPVPVSLPDVNAAPGSVISVPVTVGEVTGLTIALYELQVTFDPTVIEPADPAYIQTGTLSSNSFVFVSSNHTAGHLLMQASPNSGNFAGSGTLLYLRFTVVGTSGQSTTLAFEDYTAPNNSQHPGFRFNEGYPTRTTTNGSVTVSDAAIAGNVLYGNSAGTSPYVADVMISGAGSVAGLTTTDLSNGTYLLSGFGGGSYTVTPSKTGGVNGAISSFDAARIAQHVAGTVVLTGNKLIVADVSGNGTLTSFDAGQIALFVAAVPGFGSAGNWIFNPVSRSYPSVASIISGENYSALLMGEVSGNWTNGAARPAFAAAPARGATVELPHTVEPVGKEIVVPVNVSGVANKGIISYEFDLKYDPTVVQPEKDAVDLAGTVSRGLTVVTSAYEPGLFRVVVYGAMPIDSDGVLLNLRFAAVGKAGSVSPLTFERIMFNEGEWGTAVSDGSIELF